MRTELNGLRIDPSIPSAWDGFTIRKLFRGKWLNISVQNPNHVQSGVQRMTVNGKEVSGNFLPAETLEAVNEITVTLG